MINTDKLNELLHVDKEKMTVTVAAGMKLEKLHKLLELRDLALSNLGSISDQSVAGAMATATHGTGAEYASLCASVRQKSTFLVAYTISGCRSSLTHIDEARPLSLLMFD